MSYCFWVKLNEFVNCPSDYLLNVENLGFDLNGWFRLDVTIVAYDDGNSFYNNNLDMKRIYSLDFKISDNNPIEIFEDINIDIVEELWNYEDRGNGYIVDKQEGFVYSDYLKFCVTRI